MSLLFRVLALSIICCIQAQHNDRQEEPQGYLPVIPPYQPGHVIELGWENNLFDHVLIEQTL